MSRVIRPLSSLAAVAWMALLFWLSSHSVLPGPDLFFFQDKVIHAIAYGILGGLLLLSMPLQADGFSHRQVWTATLIASLYGISDEFHQSFVPGRDASLGDWVADTTGALLATLLLRWFSRRVVAQQPGSIPPL